MPNSGLFIQKIRYLMVLNSGFTDPVIIPNLTENKCQKNPPPLSKCLNIHSMTLFVLLLECKDVRKIYFNALSLNYQWFFFKTKTQPNLSIMQGKIKYSPVLYYILSEILFYHWCVKMLVESLKSLLLGGFF